ncbi:hypothetical protein PO909_002170 [Leuciscus waleckii]
MSSLSWLRHKLPLTNNTFSSEGTTLPKTSHFHPTINNFYTHDAYEKFPPMQHCQNDDRECSGCVSCLKYEFCLL